jgi:hypothetical protein
VGKSSEARGSSGTRPSPKAELLERWSTGCGVLSHHDDMFIRKLVGTELTGHLRDA